MLETPGNDNSMIRRALHGRPEPTRAAAGAGQEVRDRPMTSDARQTARSMSAIPPLSVDKRTSGERAKNDAIDP